MYPKNERTFIYIHPMYVYVFPALFTYFPKEFIAIYIKYLITEINTEYIMCIELLII